MHTARRLFSAVASAFVVVLMVSACSADGPEVTAGDAPGAEQFAQAVTRAIAEATKAEASKDQLAQLEDAARDGRVSTEAERQALRRTVACLGDAGYEAEILEDVIDGGWNWPHLRVAGDGNADAVIEKCSQHESHWLDYLYQTQPAAVEMKDRYLKKQLPIVVACLGREGVDVPADEDISVTLGRALTLTQTTNGRVNCLDEAAISSY
jgi:hypothetical protein